MEEQQTQWNAKIDRLPGRMSSVESELTTTKQELKSCKEIILDRERQIEEMQKSYEAKVISMDYRMLDSRVAVQHAACRYESAATDMETDKEVASEQMRTRELLSQVTEKTMDIQILVEQLDSHKERVENLRRERDSFHGDLAACSEHDTVEIDLDEAQIREDILEIALSSCRKELKVCKEELELYKKDVFEEKYCNGVYKELISKLNRINDSLEEKNKRLVEEIGYLKNYNDASIMVRSLGEKSSYDRHLKDENTFLRSQKVKFTAEIGNMNRQLRALANERDCLKATAISLQERVDNLQEANDELKVTVECLESIQMEGALKQNLRLQEELKRSKKSLIEVSNRARGMRHKFSQDIEAAKVKEMSLTQQVEFLKSRNEALERRLEEQEKN